MDIQALLIAAFNAANAFHNFLTRRAIFFYFVAIGAGFGLNYYGWQRANVYIGIYAIICLMRYVINLTPMTTATAIGAFNGAMNEPQTVIGESARIIRSYFDKTTLAVAIIAGLPFAVLATIPYRENPDMFGFFIFGSMLLGLIIWKYPGKKIEKISMAVGLAFLICGIVYPVLTSDLARGFGIDIHMPATYKTKQARISLEEAERRIRDDHHAESLRYFEEQRKSGKDLTPVEDAQRKKIEAEIASSSIF